MILPPEAVIIGFDEDTWEPLWEFPKGDDNGKEHITDMDGKTGMDTLRDFEEERWRRNSPLGE